MARTFQVTFDCADVHVLSRYYVAALDYKHAEPPAGFASWEAAPEAWGVSRGGRRKPHR